MARAAGPTQLSARCRSFTQVAGSYREGFWGSRTMPRAAMVLVLAVRMWHIAHVGTTAAAGRAPSPASLPSKQHVDSEQAEDPLGTSHGPAGQQLGHAKRSAGANVTADPGVDAGAEPRSLGEESLHDLEDCTEEGVRSPRGKRRRQEGVMSPLELKEVRGSTAVFVTEITSQEWCEMQLDFTLRVNKGRAPETAQMRHGRDRHLEVELEVHTLETVAMTSREDVVGLKLLNLRSSALALNDVGLVREVPVFGWVKGGQGVEDGESIWVTGVVDQLQLLANGKVGIHELKTRSRPSMPSFAQQRCTHLQMMLYKRLWDQLVVQGINAEDLARIHRVSLTAAFGEALQGQLRRAASMATNLAELARDTTDALLFCTTIDPNFTVEYQHRPSRSSEYNLPAPKNASGEGYILGTTDVIHDEALLLRFLGRSLKYWYGSRKPSGVQREDSWKCNYCPYFDQCLSRPLLGNRAGDAVRARRREL